MPVITGKQYIDRIDGMGIEVWIDGHQITGKISEHPAFCGVMKSQAALYDLQHDASKKDMLTYTSPTSGEPVGISFLQPRTKEDLMKKRMMVREWASTNYGLMGRSPDYMNTAVTAFATSAGFLEGKLDCFPENLRNYYTYIREHDCSLTHTFIDPQVNRSSSYMEDMDEPIGARVVEENEEGIIIKGARLLATQGGMTEELFVLSSGHVLEEGKGYSFAIPTNTKGLRFICRESFASNGSAFDFPLSSRFEEMDTVVVFDNVLVPWERVFFYDNQLVASEFMVRSSFQPYGIHQVITRQIVKTEFILGIAQAIVQTIQIGEYQHVQEKVTEIIVGLETLKALLERSEQEARINEWGFMEPDRATLHVAITIFPKIYPRFTEIIQLLGASGMMSIPKEADFQSPIKKDLQQYLQARGAEAEERVKLFRLAWDLTMSPFGTRQTHYERFFFGDPIKVGGLLYLLYDKQKYVENINDLIK